jgi:hypothetical protein
MNGGEFTSESVFGKQSFLLFDHRVAAELPQIKQHRGRLGPAGRGDLPRRRLPGSFKELNPTRALNPRAFFREMVWKPFLTQRGRRDDRPAFPKLKEGQVALTWIGHASFLIQFADLNVLINPIFANWLFLLKRLKRAGLKFKDLPPADLVLLTHAHFGDWAVAPPGELLALMH